MPSTSNIPVVSFMEGIAPMKISSQMSTSFVSTTRSPSPTNWSIMKRWVWLSLCMKPCMFMLTLPQSRNARVRKFSSAGEVVRLMLTLVSPDTVIGTVRPWRSSESAVSTKSASKAVKLKNPVSLVSS